MEQRKSKVKDLKVGDLVTHVLYGRDWIGVIVAFRQQKNLQDPRSERALVQIQPGTKFEDFFKTKVSEKERINDSLGWITSNWLYKIEITNAKNRPSRNETPPSGRKNKKIP
jgi:hypothetical protein